MNLEEVKQIAQDRRGVDGIELRVYGAEIVRVEQRDGGMPTLVGHAAVFNQETDIAGYFLERVAPGAFQRAIEDDDVRALFNHDVNFVLGRNRAKPTPTLELAEDSTGLLTTTFPPDTTYARDLVVSIGRGDVSQMSFAFRVRKETWEEKGKHEWLRTIQDVELFDISPVTFPAYPTTDVGLRSLKQFKDAAEAQARGVTSESQRRAEHQAGLLRLVLNGL